MNFKINTTNNKKSSQARQTKILNCGEYKLWMQPHTRKGAKCAK